MDGILLTIITPTYNRAHTLPKVYQSLKNQTDKRFKWMIVDDGSTDNTKDIVSIWKKENLIPIEYIKKQNGGKASALNIGIERLSTAYAVCLDSDDIFYKKAVEYALTELERVKNVKTCCGVLALRNNPDGTVMGGREIPDKYQMVSAQDIFLKLQLRTELICFYKTFILKQFKFPEFKGEKFVSPAWMQYEITKNYKYKTSHKHYCQCEYITDGLTKNKNKVIVKNPKGYTCVKRQSFNLSLGLKTRIKHGIMYDCGCLLSNEKNWLKGVKHKIWAVVLMPIAVIVMIIRFGKYL